MTPKIIIRDFSAGLQTNKYKPAVNGFSFSSGIDTFSEPGLLQSYYGLSFMDEASSPNDVQHRIKDFEKFSGVYYAIDTNGNIYDYDNTYSGAWGIVHTDANTAATVPSIIEFNSNLYWASNNYVGKFDGSTWTDSAHTFKTGNPNHPMYIAEDMLLIGDGRYLALISSDGTFNDEALDLPEGVTITDIVLYGTYAIIAATKDEDTYLYKWDLTSTTYDSELIIKNEEAIKLFPWKNVLLIFCNTHGNIYQYNGAVAKKLFQLPGAETDTVYFANHGVIQVGSDVVFTTRSNNKRLSQIWKIVDNPEGASLIGLIDYNPTDDSTVYLYEGIYKSSSGIFYVGVYDSSLGARIAQVSSNKVNSILETQVYTLSNSENKAEVKGVEVIAEPLPTYTSIDVYYKRDQESTWQTLGTITPSTQDNILRGIKGLVKTIQLKLVIKPSGASSPKISEIRIY